MEAREDPLGETVELFLVPTRCAQLDSAQLSVPWQCGGGTRGWGWGGRHAHYTEASGSSAGWQHTASRGYDHNHRAWFCFTVNIVGRMEGRRRWLWFRAVWHSLTVGNLGGGELIGRQGDRQLQGVVWQCVPSVNPFLYHTVKSILGARHGAKVERQHWISST